MEAGNWPSSPAEVSAPSQSSATSALTQYYVPKFVPDFPCRG